MAEEEAGVDAALKAILSENVSVSLLAPSDGEHNIGRPMLGSDVYASVLSFRNSDGTSFVRWSYRLGDTADFDMFALLYRAVTQMSQELLKNAIAQYGYNLETAFRLMGWAKHN